VFLTAGLLDRGEYALALEVAQQAANLARAHALWPPMRILSLVTLGAVHRALLMPDRARAVHLEAHMIQADMPMLSKMTAGELCVDCALAGDWATAYDYAVQGRSSASEWSRPFVGQPWYET